MVSVPEEVVVPTGVVTPEEVEPAVPVLAELLEVPAETVLPLELEEAGSVVP